MNTDGKHGFCFPSLFFGIMYMGHVHVSYLYSLETKHGPCFVSNLYSLFIMYMGHVHVSYLYSLFIKTWAMFCFLSLFFVYHVHGPCTLFPIFILCLSCTWAKNDLFQNMAHVLCL